MYHPFHIVHRDGIAPLITDPLPDNKSPPQKKRFSYRHCPKVQQLQKKLPKKGWAPVLLISAMASCKNQAKFTPLHRKNNTKKFQNLNTFWWGPKIFYVFFSNVSIKFILELFQHIIQVKHILCEKSCEKYISSNDWSTFWKLIQNKIPHTGDTESLDRCG